MSITLFVTLFFVAMIWSMIDGAGASQWPVLTLRVQPTAGNRVRQKSHFVSPISMAYARLNTSHSVQGGMRGSVSLTMVHQLEQLTGRKVGVCTESKFLVT